MKPERLKIIGLRSENIKRIVAVEIHPHGNMVKLTGRNAQGKSSVLDSIWWALAGKDAIQSDPIRHGETEARIQLDMGELIVTRKFKTDGEGRYTTSVAVAGADGVKVPGGAQTMLDSFLGSLSFDPLKFSRLEPKARIETLRSFVPDVDFDAIDKLNKADYDARTTVSRQAKEARASATALVIPPNLPAGVIDDSALLAEMENASTHNSGIESEKVQRARFGEAVKKTKTDADQARKHATVMRAEIERLTKEAEAADAQAKKLDEKALSQQQAIANLPPLAEPINPAAIRVKIQEAKQHNELARKRDERAAAIQKAVKLEADAQRLTDQIDQRNTAKAKAIAEANLPVPGLGFGAGDLTLNGVPFGQASTGEQLKAGVLIGMAHNPTLRVILVRDGSLLDDENQALLAELADQHDMQVWMECVGEPGETGFVIEDGMVRDAAAVVAA